MRTKIFQRSVADVFRATLLAIRDCDMYVESKDKDEGKIVATTRSSLRSWGETVSIQITRKGDECIVVVESEPSAQLFDWGKSSENEAAIINRLTELLG